MSKNILTKACRPKVLLIFTTQLYSCLFFFFFFFIISNHHSGVNLFFQTKYIIFGGNIIYNIMIIIIILIIMIIIEDNNIKYRSTIMVQEGFYRVGQNLNYIEIFFIKRYNTFLKFKNIFRLCNHNPILLMSCIHKREVLQQEYSQTPRISLLPTSGG